MDPNGANLHKAFTDVSRAGGTRQAPHSCLHSGRQLLKSICQMPISYAWLRLSCGALRWVSAFSMQL